MPINVMENPRERRALDWAGISVPRVIYGTSYLGNLYGVLPFEKKLELMAAWFQNTEKPVVIDTAGKYGAGLALEVIGKGLSGLGITPDEIVISNKLGWFRVPLTSDEPTFEPGAWAGLENDCILKFGYRGIMDCYEQGNDLLGDNFHADLVSVHDPDEYLESADSLSDRAHRLDEILESYRALFDLKDRGEVKAVGIGSKDWRVIRELYDHVPFDWVMLANSYTLFRHPSGLLDFMDRLAAEGVGIINSALFHGGFLTGGESFDYRPVDHSSSEGGNLYHWRDQFFGICRQFDVTPAAACLHFGLSHPAIAAVALNTSKPVKMQRNMEILCSNVPDEFWTALKKAQLIGPQFHMEYLSRKDKKD